MKIYKKLLMHMFWREDVYPSIYESKRDHVKNIVIGLSLIESLYFALIVIVMQKMGICNVWKDFYFKTHYHFLAIQTLIFLCVYLFHFFYYIKSGRYIEMMSEYKEELKKKGIDNSERIYSFKYQYLMWLFLGGFFVSVMLVLFLLVFY